MDLYIVRHGIAIDREDPKCPPDAEPYLTEEGMDKTRQVAKGIVALGITPDLLISSPYTRAMQTAEIFASALDYSKQKIRRTDLLLPGAESSALFREHTSHHFAQESRCRRPEIKAHLPAQRRISLAGHTPPPAPCRKIIFPNTFISELSGYAPDCDSRRDRGTDALRSIAKSGGDSLWN